MGLWSYELQNKEVSRQDFLKKTIRNETDRKNFIGIFQKQINNRLPTLQSQWTICIERKNAPQVCEVMLHGTDRMFVELQQNIDILKSKRMPKEVW